MQWLKLIWEIFLAIFAKNNPDVPRPPKPSPDPSPEPTPTPQPEPDRPEELSEAQIRLVKLHNEERLKRSKISLEPNTELMQAAQYHAEWMAANKRMSHKGANRSSPFQRIKATGYEYNYAAENVAYGGESLVSIMRMWMRSRGHRNNLLNGRFIHIGTGVAENSGRFYYCAVFGSPK